MLRLGAMFFGSFQRWARMDPRINLNATQRERSCVPVMPCVWACFLSDLRIRKCVPNHPDSPAQCPPGSGTGQVLAASQYSLSGPQWSAEDAEET